ncbi:MAG: hypothetical protein M3092_09955 [Actinomycetia bacterium]|nr:hypothetical protein [Actinomycetes bacterium]
MMFVSKVLALAIMLLGAGSILVAPAQAVAPATCPERFPQVEWNLVLDGDVGVYTADVPDAMGERFSRETGIASGWIAEDIGSFEAVVCLVGEDAAFVGDQFARGSRGFHAHSDLNERFVLIETQRPGFVGPAVSFALAHQALWQNNGERAFPEPIASVIAQWYRARILERLELYHAEVMFENFFDTDAVIDWSVESQEVVTDWIPENNFRAIGDFVGFAVTEHGTEILLETDGAVWKEIEGEWRIGLRSDLTGRDTPTTDWVFGVAIAVAILLVAVVAIGLGLWSKHRKKDRAATAPPLPGFFSER